MQTITDNLSVNQFQFNQNAQNSSGKEEVSASSPMTNLAHSFRALVTEKEGKPTTMPTANDTHQPDEAMQQTSRTRGRCLFPSEINLRRSMTMSDVTATRVRKLDFEEEKSEPCEPKRLSKRIMMHSLSDSMLDDNNKSQHSTVGSVPTPSFGDTPQLPESVISNASAFTPVAAPAAGQTTTTTTTATTTTNNSQASFIITSTNTPPTNRHIQHHVMRTLSSVMRTSNSDLTTILFNPGSNNSPRSSPPSSPRRMLRRSRSPSISQMNPANHNHHQQQFQPVVAVGMDFSKENIIHHIDPSTVINNNNNNNNYHNNNNNNNRIIAPNNKSLWKHSSAPIGSLRRSTSAIPQRHHAIQPSVVIHPIMETPTIEMSTPAIEITAPNENSSISPAFSQEMPPLLPICYKKEVNYITVDTVAKVIRQEICAGIRYIIVDCRFEYEYDGGHIEQAINLKTPEQVEQEFLRSVHPSPEKLIIIFHCEFSQQRGPTMCKFLRESDRNIHIAEYPKLYYPEIYVMHGGYKLFFESYPQLCNPQNYIKMDDPAFQADLKKNKVIGPKTIGRMKRSQSESCIHTLSGNKAPSRHSSNVRPLGDITNTLNPHNNHGDYRRPPLPPSSLQRSQTAVSTVESSLHLPFNFGSNSMGSLQIFNVPTNDNDDDL